MKKVSVCFILVCLFCSNLVAQQWTELGPIPFPVNVSGQINGIGRVTQMVFHPTLAHKRYATSASGGLYYSSDTGWHWQRLGTDMFNPCNLASVCVDHVNDQVLYVSTGDPNYYSTDYGIYKSTNGGATWAPANSGMGSLMAVDLWMHPSNNQYLVAATNNGIWLSTDGAVTWNVVKTGGAFTHMKQVPNTSVLLAVTASSVWKSTNNGATWNQINNITFGAGGSNGMRVMTNKVAPQTVYIISNGNNGQIYKSTDTGTSFTSIYQSTTECLVCYDEDPVNAGQGNYDLAGEGDPLDPNHLYVAAHCLWESTDGGLSWQRKTDWWAHLHTDHHQFVFDPYNNQKLWSINDGGIWLRQGTNDSLWNPMSDGISATEIYHAASSPTDKKLISIGTQDNGELYKNHQGWFTNRGGDWTSTMYFDYSSQHQVYYMSDGERRSFGSSPGTSDYNSPFTPTNNSRIAFQKSLPGLAILAKDTVWKTTNLDAATPTWSAVFAISNPIRDMVISTADSNRAFVMHNNKISRIDNLLTSPTVTSYNLPASASVRGSIASVRSNIDLVYMSCNSRVYRSTDAGANWVNVTYNLPTTNILKIYHDDFSSNERVFVCSGYRIFTKTASDTVWQDISFNLPTIANLTDFMLINDGTIASKLRVSYYGRGAWEYKLYPQLPPIADFLPLNSYICPGDTLRFLDKSFDDSLSYAWSFTGGTPATSSAANPFVVYTTPGTYPVSLTVTNVNGSDTKTVTAAVTVSTGQGGIDTSGPGKAIYLQGGGSSYVTIEPLKLNSNQLTFMCWIKPDGVQHDWSGLMFGRGNGTTSGMSIKDDYEIRYHWNDEEYWVSTGLYATPNEWNHCAMVVSPSEIRIYVNGKEFIQNGNYVIQEFNNTFALGADLNGGSRKFKGWIDEAVIYKKALSKNEIREKMHLIKFPVQAQDSLFAYWQFNNLSAGNTLLNSVQCKYQGQWNNSVQLVTSSGPFGHGSSQRVTINSGTLLNLSQADLQCSFPVSGTSPDGDVVFTHLRNNPDVMPMASTEYSGNYWIIDNYGNNASFSGLDSIHFFNAGTILGQATDYQLFTRDRNADGATWGSAIATAGAVLSGMNGSIHYPIIQTPISQDGQFVSKGPYYPLGISAIKEVEIAWIYPNPASNEIHIFLPSNQKMNLRVMNLQGEVVLEQENIISEEIVSIRHLATGTYLYTLRNESKAVNGRFVKE